MPKRNVTFIIPDHPSVTIKNSSPWPDWVCANAVAAALAALPRHDSPIVVRFNDTTRNRSTAAANAQTHTATVTLARWFSGTRCAIEQAPPKDGRRLIRFDYPQMGWVNETIRVGSVHHPMELLVYSTTLAIADLIFRDEFGRPSHIDCEHYEGQPIEEIKRRYASHALHTAQYNHWPEWLAYARRYSREIDYGHAEAVPAHHLRKLRARLPRVEQQIEKWDRLTQTRTDKTGKANAVRERNRYRRELQQITATLRGASPTNPLT